MAVSFCVQMRDQTKPGWRLRMRHQTQADSEVTRDKGGRDRETKVARNRDGFGRRKRPSVWYLILRALGHMCNTGGS